jgi:apolipoprotein N-acyltransferase
VAGFSKVLRLWPWLAAILTGVLCAACFAPFDYFWLCWVALTPLLAAVWFSGENSKRRWLRDLALGYLAGLAFFWIVFSWLHTVTVPGLVLVGFYMGIYFAFWAWFCGMLRPGLRKVRPKTRQGVDAISDRLNQKYAGPSARPATDPLEDSPERRSPWLRSTNNLRLAFLLAAAWVMQESLRSVVLSGWGWNTLGHALHGQLALIQIAEFTGVAGLSFLVAFTNVILLTTVRRFILETQVRPMKPHYDLTLTMAAIIGVMAFGLHSIRLEREGKRLNVALVQPNIPREEKFTVEFENKIFEQFTRLSRPALDAGKRPDLLVWPESSMPDVVLGDNTSHRFVMDFSASAQTDLLLGTLDFDPPDAYNAALLVSDAGTRTQLYRKVHLVPFGEYIPGRHTIPFIARVVGDQVPADFSFGKEYTVFQLSNDNGKVAPLICFEDTIGELTRQFVRSGANLLVNVTNDGWFLRTAASRQHLANAVFRCVETRLSMVRAANTGVTCFINDVGKITHTLVDENGSQFTEGVLTGPVSVPRQYKPTFYVRHGELFAQVCVGITTLVLLFLGVRLVRQRRS